MTDFIIDYNPYLVRCTFIKDGEALGDNTRLGAKSDQRLQILQSPAYDWDGLLPEISEECGDTRVRITFKGRRIDYEDLVYDIERYTGGTVFETVLEEGKNEAEIMDELDKIITEIKAKDLVEFDEVTTENVGIFEAYEEAKSGIFEISVIATMSSGKSTLINSLLHTELLPSENKACTATIARILDNSDMDGFEAECFDKDRNLLYPRSHVSAELISQYNRDEEVQYIDIEGNIPAIRSNKIRLCLVDTPGPNNSRNDNHERLTRSIIKRTNSVILYVMNATQFGINDDHQLLYDISSEMKRAGKQSRDRFIFVINKCDALDVEKGETVDKLLIDVRDYLSGFGIEDPTIIPTSARMALIIRKQLAGERLSGKERRELSGLVDYFVETPLLHFEKYATLTPSVKAALEKEIESYREDDERELETLIHTGIPVVEATISEYVDKYAYPIKINDAIKNILNVITEINMKGQFEKKLAEDSELLRKTRLEIARAEKQYEESLPIYKSFKERVQSLNLDSLNRTGEQFKVEMELSSISKEFDGKTKVDKSLAESLIRGFQARLNSYQKDCESRIQRDIDEQFFKKCGELLSEYTRTVSGIVKDLKIEGFDFKKVSSLGEIRISSIDQLVRRNQEDRIRTEVRYKDNPERAGFFGFFKFWKPKRISYTAEIKEGVDVNVKNVIVDILAEFSRAMKNNIKQIFDQADAQISEYKEAFNTNIDRLDSKIKTILLKLKVDTENSEDIAERVSMSEEKLNWISGIETDIGMLLMA